MLESCNVKYLLQNIIFNPPNSVNSLFIGKEYSWITGIVQDINSKFYTTRASWVYIIRSQHVTSILPYEFCFLEIIKASAASRQYKKKNYFHCYADIYLGFIWCIYQAYSHLIPFYTRLLLELPHCRKSRTRKTSSITILNH